MKRETYNKELFDKLEQVRNSLAMEFKKLSKKDKNLKKFIKLVYRTSKKSNSPMFDSDEIDDIVKHDDELLLRLTMLIQGILGYILNKSENSELNAPNLIILEVMNLFGGELKQFMGLLETRIDCHNHK